MTRIIRLFLAALRGTETNFTSGNINRAIFMLSVPMILEMVMEALFAIVDVFFVAKVGTEAVATVGLTESVLTLVYSIAIGLSTAATALVARRIGEENPTEASKAVGQVIFISLTFAILMGVPGLVFADDLLRLMGGDAHLTANGHNYTRVIFMSAPAIILLHTLSGCLRGAGDASVAMRSLWLANGINIVLCPVFIFGLGPFPALGVTGSAVATTLGRSAGVLYQFYALAKLDGRISINLASFVPDLNVVKTLLGLAAGSTGQFLIGSASWVFLTRLVSTFGSDVVAGYTVAIRIFVFTILPSWGMANAAATLVGQNLGANQPDRAETSVWRAAFCNLLFLLPIGLLLWVFAENVVGIFSRDVAVLTIGVQSLRIFCLGFVFMAYGMVLTQALNGAGDTRSPMLINILCFWVVEIPLAYVLANLLNWGPSGVFWSVAISESLLALVAVWVFRRGTWRTVTV
jgi:putative MATE family efflux protein